MQFTRCIFSLSISLLILSGCSTINIQQVEAKKLRINVDYHKSTHQQALDVYVTRGVWQQPVSLDGVLAEVSLADQGFIELKPTHKKGRYGFRQKGAFDVQALAIHDYRVEFPFMPPAQIESLNAFEGRLFLKGDEIRLALPETTAESRFMVATGYCGGTPYRSEQKISTAEFELTVPLTALMKQINNAAEADLNGIIPVSFAIENRYQSQWPKPFAAPRLTTSDSTEFSVDTSGFRFQAKVAVSLSSAFALTLQNQAWPVQYCF